MFFEKLRFLSEPESVWNVLCNSQDLLAMITTPSNNIVHRVSGSPVRFAAIHVWIANQPRQLQALAP